MGDHDDRLAAVAPAPHLLPEVHIGAPVEALVGLVQQHHVGIAEFGHDQVELLPGATGELPRRPAVAGVPVERGGPAATVRAGRVAGEPAARADEHEMLVGEQEVVGAAVLRAVAEGAVHLDRAAVGRDQPGADPQERALARAVGADDRGDLARPVRSGSTPRAPGDVRTACRCRWPAAAPSAGGPAALADRRSRRPPGVRRRRRRTRCRGLAAVAQVAGGLGDDVAGHGRARRRAGAARRSGPSARRPGSPRHHLPEDPADHVGEAVPRPAAWCSVSAPAGVRR